MSSLSFDLLLPCAVCLETKSEIRPGAYSHFMRGEGARVSCIVSSDCCLSLREHMTCHARAGSTSYPGQFPIVTPCAVQMAIIPCGIADKSKVTFAIVPPTASIPLELWTNACVCLCHRGCK